MIAHLTTKTSCHFSYDYSQFDGDKFLTDYAEIDTSFLADQSIGLNGKFDNFLLSIHCLIDKHCPQKKLNKKRLKLRNKPWINSRIQKMMRIRDRLFERFKANNSAADVRAFKLFGNRVVNELKECKKTTIISILTKTRAI